MSTVSLFVTVYSHRLATDSPSDRSVLWLSHPRLAIYTFPAPRLPPLTFLEFPSAPPSYSLPPSLPSRCPYTQCEAFARSADARTDMIVSRLGWPPQPLLIGRCDQSSRIPKSRASAPCTCLTLELSNRATRQPERSSNSVALLRRGGICSDRVAADRSGCIVAVRREWSRLKNVQFGVLPPAWLSEVQWLSAVGGACAATAEASNAKLYQFNLGKREVTLSPHRRPESRRAAELYLDGC